MAFWSEFKKLKSVFWPWLLMWFGLTIFFFGFGIDKGYPYPSLNSIAVLLLDSVRQDILPQEVRLVALNPLNAFASLMLISLALSFIVSFPFFLYKLIRYLSPALYQKEKKAIFKIIIPSAALFILGCVFSYLIIIPITFEMLYAFAEVVEIESFFYIAQFVPFVIGLMVIVGVLFLLPIFMVLMSRFGIVDSKSWINKWRYAILVFLILCAIVTPDGTGIPMMILAAPMTGLYFIGAVIAKRQ